MPLSDNQQAPLLIRCSVNVSDLNVHLYFSQPVHMDDEALANQAAFTIHAGNELYTALTITQNDATVLIMGIFDEGADPSPDDVSLNPSTDQINFWGLTTGIAVPPTVDYPATIDDPAICTDVDYDDASTETVAIFDADISTGTPPANTSVALNAFHIPKLCTVVDFIAPNNIRLRPLPGGDYDVFDTLHYNGLGGWKDNDGNLINAFTIPLTHV